MYTPPPPVFALEANQCTRTQSQHRKTPENKKTDVCLYQGKC